ncbi:MAG: hypothetical protein ACOX6W_04540 [Lentisphaeria bacterium]|jgi:hypothetical protein
MEKHLYLSLMPEALIASQLDPKAFGAYYAVGTEAKTQGQAAFFEIDPDFRSDYFPIERALQQCHEHEDGRPKNSVYISVYRVIEHVPLAALGTLHLVTKDGRTLSLNKSTNLPEDVNSLHLYNEIAPINPLVASSLAPKAFHKFMILDPNAKISLPALCWAECTLGNLAEDPEYGDVGDLPYDNIDHLRSCLIHLRTKHVVTKIVDRLNPPSFAYRTIKNGVYYGTREGLVIYPLPSVNELKTNHYPWWRSANM